jgi:hypothetical protein
MQEKSNSFMYQYLAKYFSLNKRLVLPGIGLLNASVKPSQLEFVEKTLHAPVYAISFQQDENATDHQFISFLSKEINVSEHDAGNRFSNFVQQIIYKLQPGFGLQLPGLGFLSKNDDAYDFISTDTLQQIYPGVAAERVIRQNAQHTVRVGEDHKTSAEMYDILHKEATHDRWWIAAIVLSVVGIAAILYYYLTLK